MANKRRHQKSIFPKILFTLLFIAAIIIAVLVAKDFFTNTTTNDTHDERHTSTVASTTTQKDISDTTTTTSDSYENKDENGIATINTEDPNLSSYVTGSISKALFTKNNTYRLAITTDQALSEGTCNLTFSSSNHTITASAEIVAHPNSSSCTFDLSAEEVTSGFWDVQVTIHTTQDRSGTIKDRIEVTK